MLLYQDLRAPNPRRVRIFLAEKGLEVETCDIEIMAKDHFTKKITDLNPFARVPFLVLDNGTVISETIAICRYFEELHPNPPLFGTGAEQVALIEMWQRRVELELFFTVAQAFRHTNPHMAELEVPQVSDWGNANAARLDDVLSKFDTSLANSKFIAGDSFSIADITLLVSIDFMRVLRRRLNSQNHPNLARWHEMVSQRPGCVK